jgi:hypothetical protein
MDLACRHETALWGEISGRVVQPTKSHRPGKAGRCVYTWTDRAGLGIRIGDGRSTQPESKGANTVGLGQYSTVGGILQARGRCTDWGCGAEGCRFNSCRGYSNPPVSGWVSLCRGEASGTLFRRAEGHLAWLGSSGAIASRES